jgi:hypothetical protein
MLVILRYDSSIQEGRMKCTTNLKKYKVRKGCVEKRKQDLETDRDLKRSYDARWRTN